jgi:hypothetical protein
VSTAEKGRSAGSGAGEQGLRGWCSVRWSPELFRCWNSAIAVFYRDRVKIKLQRSLCCYASTRT